MTPDAARERTSEAAARYNAKNTPARPALSGHLPTWHRMEVRARTKAMRKRIKALPK